MCPASEWKEDIEWSAFHTLSDLKQYPTQLICDCSKKPALRKTKKSLIKDRVFHVKRPISHGVVSGQ